MAKKKKEKSQGNENGKWGRGEVKEDEGGRVGGEGKKILFLKSTNPETLQVLAPPPPIYYTALPSNSREIRRNFITTDNVNNNNNNRGYVGNDKEEEESPQPYDGISTVENGFRYFLPRHYHEETQRKDKEERVGSFGYIDPFGIRRVIYYNSSPGKGFVHKKNNRYVGFSATPYDPRPKSIK